MTIYLLIAAVFLLGFVEWKHHEVINSLVDKVVDIQERIGM